MRNVVTVAMTIALIAGTTLAADDEAKTDTKTKGLTQMQKVSYCIGLDMGSNFKQMDLAVDTDLLAQGIKAGVSGAEPMLTEAQIKEVMTQFQKEMMVKQKEIMAKQQEEMKEQGKVNKVKGEKFLAENKKKEGVKTTESGLQYIVIKEGEGDTPSDDDTVSVDYVGTLLDGTKFDSSYDRGQPYEFPLGKGQVIKGWDIGIANMQKGEKGVLIIPSELAYGQGRRGIPPFSTLVFEVELVDFEK